MVKKSVSDILKERILKTIEESNKLPWESPWYYRYAMNYSTQHQYTGINRWLLPVGEYMSAKQLQRYNKTNGTEYKFMKGIKWREVLFMKDCIVGVKRDDLSSEALSTIMNGGAVREGSNTYYMDKEGRLVKKYLVRKYYRVADITYFEDKNGNKPPSKVEGADAIIEFENTEPDKIIENYCKRSGVKIEDKYHNEAYYTQELDCVCVPNIREFKSVEVYYSTIFHELIHSTGTKGRLNRDSYVEYHKSNQERSEEELIAEMGACLLCAEAGIHTLDYSGESEYFTIKNSEAYIKSWYMYLKDTDIDIVSIASKAEKAANYILGVSSSESSEIDDDTVSISK